MSDKLVMMTDDGSYGEKGLVTNALKSLIEGGEKYDRVITIGPLIMMKFVCGVTKEYGIPTVATPGWGSLPPGPPSGPTIWVFPA